MFSSGLFGLMPRQLYTDLFRILKENVTLVVLEDVAPVNAKTFDCAADALAVDKLGFLSHSSFDKEILASDRVKAAVLCDPVVVPQWSTFWGGFKGPTNVENDVPMRILKASRAYGFNGIPDFIGIEADSVRVFDNCGHADILDDTWADLGPRLIPWMRPIAQKIRNFETWENAKNQPVEMRKQYRQEIAREINAMFTPSVSDIVIAA